MGKAISINGLLKKRYKKFDFTGEWFDAFKKPEQKGVWFIWGNSGNGKTSFVTQLVKYLSGFSNVLFNALEEGHSDTMKNAFINAGFTEEDGGVMILERESMADFEKRLEKKKSANIVVIDSFQYTRMSYDDYIRFKEKFHNKLIIFVSHATGSKPTGRPAESVMYDSSLKIWVEGYKAISKGRYIGEKGEYVIWEERADTYWLGK